VPRIETVYAAGANVHSPKQPGTDDSREALVALASHAVPSGLSVLAGSELATFLPARNMWCPNLVIGNGGQVQ
jgi:hypothetical protein